MISISKDLLYLVRAILFGIAVGYTVFAFFFYFKAFTENTFNIKKIDMDIWWWSGMTLAILSGLLAAALLM